MQNFIKIFILAIFLSFAWNLNPLQANSTIRILLIPFSVEPLSEVSLSKSIQNTIAFSLISHTKIQLVHSDESWQSSDLFKTENQQKIIQLAQEKQCTHAIYGSVNIFGKNLSLGAVILNILNKKIVHSGSEVLNNIDDIPKWINQWLERAIDKIALPKVTHSKQKSFEKLTKSRMVMIDDEIIGMDIADINEDLHNEILLYSPKKITIYKKNMTILGSQKAKFGKTIVHAKWISGSPPFLIVSETSGEDIVSTLYQWKDEHLIKIHSYKGWFINSLPGNDAAIQIIGQKRQYSDYWGKIFKLSGPPDQMIPNSSIALPVSANIFDFSFFGVEGQKDPLCVAYTPNDRLAVYNKNNQLLWRSSIIFGGSLHFIDVQTNTSGIDDTMRKYIPSELLISDINDDNTDDIIVCENKSSTGRLFEKTRWFSEGVIHVLTWTGSEMKPLWVSNKQPGPVTAYAIEKNKSECQLWIICVLKQNSLLRNGYSRMLVYDMSVTKIE